MRDKFDIICHCEQVTYGTILEVIDNGADTIDKLGDATMSGVTCAYCVETLEEILEEELD